MSIMVCDCCGNALYRWRWWWCCTTVPEDDDYIQNNPCQHNVCFLCFAKSTLKGGATGYCCQVKDCPQRHRVVSCQYFHRGTPGEIIENESVVELDTDLIAGILSFLPLEEIMLKRGVCKNWREAARKTIVPPFHFCVDSVDKYNAMSVMTRALPNLQQLTLEDLDSRDYSGSEDKWGDGEDPDEEWAAETADWTSHDIGVVSNFSKLRILELYDEGLNGRYPFLFSSFPLLEKLSISCCHLLKWDLEMLAGLPSLKKLVCRRNDCLTGNISSLRVLKDTLEQVIVYGCENIEGKFMDLADFPHLEILDLEGTPVTGDIRDIGKNDFSSLVNLYLPNGVYGGMEYEFQRISDAPDVVRAVYLLKKQHPALEMRNWCAKLSNDSPDWYESVGEDEYEDTPPFFVRFVEAGPRMGYRWAHCIESGDTYANAYSCEVNWLDPEPNRHSSDYGEYAEAVRELASQVSIYREFHEPPTEEVYHRVWREWKEEEEEEESVNESYDSET